MGFWKRLTEFLFVGGGFNDQFRFTSDNSLIDPVNSAVDVFDPALFVDDSCNKPDNRQCWTSNLDINTDYEEVFPEGKVRKVCVSTLFCT